VAVAIDGAALPNDANRFDTAETSVDPGYWNVIRTPIVRGRAFDATDTAASPPVAIVNETFAHRYWPGDDPIGKAVTFPGVGPGTQTSVVTAQVVGVARDARYWQLAEALQPFIYRPIAQGRRAALTMLVLARGEPSAIASAVRDAAASIDSAVPMFDMRTFDDLYQSRALLPARMMSQLVSALGVLALLLSAVGLYGVVAFLAARRTYEISIRMAIGASPGSVLKMVLGQAAAFVLPGLVIGTVSAFLLAPFLSSQEFDFVTPRDPSVFALVVILTAAVAFVAAGVPARRAARVDPAIALRAE
jgi:hypothetical protein